MQFKALVDAGAIKPLCEFLKYDDEVVKYMILDTFCIIMKALPDEVEHICGAIKTSVGQYKTGFSLIRNSTKYNTLTTIRYH